MSDEIETFFYDSFFVVDVKVTFSLNPDLIPNNKKPINIDAFTTFLLLLLQAASITSKFKKLFNI